MPRRNERRRSHPMGRAAVASALLLLALLPMKVEAQYFGRNKVNYERFDFRILRAPHFDVYFYPAESLASMDAARMLERWYARFSPFLRHTFDRRSVILFADQADFQQNNVVDIESEGTGGVTEGFRQRVVLPLTGVYADNHHVLGHELVHVFQYDISRNPIAQAGEGAPGGATTARGGGLGLHALPLWFVEGMAEYLSAGRSDPNTAMWMRDAVRRDDIPTVRQMTTDMRYFPYRYGQAFWAYVGGRFGDSAVVNLFRAALARGVEPAFRTVLQMTPDSLSRDWAAATRAAYQPVLAGRTPPEAVGTRVVEQRLRRGRGGEYNISPALSPDGRHVAFFSSRALFAMQVFIADAETGRIVARLGSINTPSHFDALSFLSSPGSWSPDGQRLAYVVYQGGDQVIDIYNLTTRRSERTITAPGVGAALDPAWSPDGRYIAFSGLAGGISDIYVHDLTTGETQQLTTGRNAEIQPSWSPDGRTLVFATDRGPATDFGQLTFGEMRLATIDVETRQVQLLPTILGGKAINPHYSPDGSSIYFVSDADGVPDLYRQEVATGNVFRITQVASGVSGISRLSPAMSVARQTGRVVFSLFRAHGYDIVRLEPAELVGTAVTAPPAAVAGILPPAAPAAPSIVQRYLADAATGLPPEPVTYAVVPYRARLGLEYLAPPTVGVAFGGPFGTQVGGGIAGLFRDELGNHNLIGIVQAQGELRDLGGQVVYQNNLRRWNFGALAGRIPSISGASFYTQEQGVLVYNQLIQRIYYNQIGAFTQYPLSPTHRVEFAAQTTRQTISQEVDRFALNQVGQVVAHERISLPGLDPVTYTQGIAAFVGDYSYFGLTSPIAGARYRLEVSPVMGGLQFLTGLADYRRYFYLRPITLAGRAMQYGRYGRDAEDTTRLRPVFVGQPWFVRGYDPGDFRGTECAPQAGTGTPANQCPVFNRLIGTRILVANAELRVPFLGPYGFGVIPTRFLPLELTPFVDMGLAWSRDESPSFRVVRGEEARHSIERVPVFSTGISARTNLFGMAILELYYAIPFQRPDRGGHFGFQVVPGW